MSTVVKEYRRLTPLTPDIDLDQLRWLTRESFDQTAANEGLVIEDYTETVLAAKDAVPVNTKIPAVAVAEEWMAFTANGVRPDSDPADEVCGCCPHPPHRSGGCEADGPEATDGRCLCPWPV